MSSESAWKRMRRTLWSIIAAQLKAVLTDWRGICRCIEWWRQCQTLSGATIIDSLDSRQRAEQGRGLVCADDKDQQSDRTGSKKAVWEEKFRAKNVAVSVIPVCALLVLQRTLPVPVKWITALHFSLQGAQITGENIGAYGFDFYLSVCGTAIGYQNSCAASGAMACLFHGQNYVLAYPDDRMKEHSWMAIPGGVQLTAYGSSNSNCPSSGPTTTNIQLICNVAVAAPPNAFSSVTWSDGCTYTMQIQHVSGCPMFAPAPTTTTSSSTASPTTTSTTTTTTPTLTTTTSATTSPSASTTTTTASPTTTTSTGTNTTPNTLVGSGSTASATGGGSEGQGIGIGFAMGVLVTLLLIVVGLYVRRRMTAARTGATVSGFPMGGAADSQSSTWRKVDEGNTGSEAEALHVIEADTESLALATSSAH